MSTAPVTNGLEHVDVLIVGAGISGIAAAYSLSTQHADKTFAILDARGASGGTWDLFRYPGIGICQAASATSGTAAASCNDRAAGLSATSSSSMAMYSAKVPMRR